MTYPELHFTGQVWRPPYEANSQLLQLTSGCTWHKCRFCSLYHGTPFRMSPLSEVEDDLKVIRQWQVQPAHFGAGLVTPICPIFSNFVFEKLINTVSMCLQ